MKLDLYVANRASLEKDERENVMAKKRRYITFLERLEEDEKIGGFEVWDKAEKRVSSGYRSASGGRGKQAIERYDKLHNWARDHGYDLRPAFREERLSRSHADEFVIFPSIYLVVGKDGGIQGAFPCFDPQNDTRYSVENYLDCVDKGIDWEHFDPAPSLTTPDYGEHGSLKSQIKQNLSEYVDDEWTDVTDEYKVKSERSGWIDLLCRNVDRNRYLLVEVKPSKDKIDKAFGQILRYKYQFVEDSNLPDLDPSDVELAIAAPSFYEFHKRAADEAGIRLIRVDGS